VYSIREATKHIREGGRIINLSSSNLITLLLNLNSCAAGTVAGFQNFGIYLATKGAVETLTKTVAQELAPKKITVNTVSPGFTKTGSISLS
jgi:3-oxoacyl-[acyl-carrier protein] reductase